jgi:hypothetical protein
MTSIQHPKLMLAIGLGASLVTWQGEGYYDYYGNFYEDEFGGTPGLIISTVATLKVIVFNRFDRGSLAFYPLLRLLLARPGHGLSSGHYVHRNSRWS